MSVSLRRRSLPRVTQESEGHKENAMKAMFLILVLPLAALGCVAQQPVSVAPTPQSEEITVVVVVSGTEGHPGQIKIISKGPFPGATYHGDAPAGKEYWYQRAPLEKGYGSLPRTYPEGSRLLVMKGAPEWCIKEFRAIVNIPLICYDEVDRLWWPLSEKGKLKEHLDHERFVRELDSENEKVREAERRAYERLGIKPEELQEVRDRLVERGCPFDPPLKHPDQISLPPTGPAPK